MKADLFQTLMIGLRGTRLTVEEERLLAERCPGGVILFGRNIASPQQVAELCARVYELCRKPPLIAVDQEGGAVNRLRRLLSVDLSPRELAAGGDLGGIRSFGRLTGELLATLGINLNLAPVVDLRISDADNSLGGRHWGGNAKDVSERAGAYLEGLQGTGVIGCLKHFPGLGRALVDSHLELPEVLASFDELRAGDMVPFAKLAGQALFVLIAHCRYTAIDGGDGMPSSCSPSVYRLLREEVGFDGAAITDDLEMGALDIFPSFTERMAAALNAGADLLPICNDPHNISQAFERVVRIAEKRLVPQKRLAKAAGRVLNAKRQIPSGFKADRQVEARFQRLDERLAQLRRELIPDEN